MDDAAEITGHSGELAERGGTEDPVPLPTADLQLKAAQGPPEPEVSPDELPDAGTLITRELSLLEFNRRVLEQARDPATPVLERLRFLTICSTNLDEFFEIRITGLREQVEQGVEGRGLDGMTPQERLTRVAEVAHDLVDVQYRVLWGEVFPALRQAGIEVHFRHEWNKSIVKWVAEYFQREVLPVLSPLGLDPAHPFPRILNKSLNFFVQLEGKDAFGRTSRGAVVQAPRLLPRLIALPKEVVGEENHFVTLTGVIHQNVGKLFPGMKVTGSYPFRVTRNSDLWVDEEEVGDLLRALKGELPRRKFGEAIRLEVNSSCPEEVTQLLRQQFDLEEADVYRVDGPVNLHRLAALIDLVELPELRYPSFAPAIPPRFAHEDSVFKVIQKGDILLHHPYESFSPVVLLVKQAAVDPKVLAIKITLYRTGEESPLTEALLEAARNGKEVTAVVELRARFDEAANIDIATRLQEAGAKVVYGVVGFKAHAKMILVVRRERDGLRRYVHLGTGNYHTGTTKLYTDFGLLSRNGELGEDVHKLFLQLTGLGKATQLKKLVQAPFNLFDRLLDLIDGEIAEAKKGRPARIMAKMNGLIEPKLISALYRASQAGVDIDLLVRGVCSLRPGVPGVSERIRVRSFVGRFLEHPRLYYFKAGGKDVLYGSSADWMPRNLFRRVEVAFPITSKKMKQRVLEEAIEPYFESGSNAWELRADGTYVKADSTPSSEDDVQSRILARVLGRRF